MSLSNYNTPYTEGNEGWSDIAITLGMDNFLKLVDLCGGQSVYIPKRQNLRVDLRNQDMVAEFSGTNHKELSRKYGVSERQVRNIISAGLKQ